MKLDEIQEAAREQFSRQSHNYGQSHILGNVEDVQFALSHIPLPPRSKVLDVAAGAGHTGLHLAGLGYDVTLADIAAPMLERVRETARARGLVVAVNQHPAEEMPYADAAFDLVTCRVAAHHFSSPEKFFSESGRVLRPGGFLLLIDGAAPDDEPEAEEWIHQVEKLRDPSHNRLLTPKRAAHLSEQAGLKVIHIEVSEFKQPDLEWYFQTAATSEENRRKVRLLVDEAPESARRIFKVAEEEGKSTWWWKRLTLVASKAADDGRAPTGTGAAR